MNEEYFDAKPSNDPAPYNLPKQDRRVNDVLLTVAELALFASLSISKIYHDVEAGRIPVKRWGKRQIGSKPTLRFKKGEIMRWLDWGCPNAQEFEGKMAKLSLTGLS